MPVKASALRGARRNLLPGLRASKELERQLSAEFGRYARDFPELAFPTFLESLYCDSLTSSSAVSGRAKNVS